MNGVLRDKKMPRRKSKMDRDRVELRADPEWIARATAAAERFELSLSAFIRMVVTERLEELERNPSPQSEGKRK
jgi:hypothetical protein